MISIIVPIYNVEKYIKRCVDSILVQSYEDIEIILVNDGSTDTSGSICDYFAKIDSRMKVIHQNNRGVSVARNAGLDKAVGKYVAFVDSDDVLPKNALETLVGVNCDKQFDMVIGDCNIIGHNLNFSYLSTEKSEYSKVDLCYEIMTNQIVRWLMSAVWGKLFVNSIIKKQNIRFDETLINGEDGIFIMDYITHTRMIFNVKTLVYNLYRYKEEERISAVSAFYYDFFRFHFMHSERLWSVVKDKLSSAKREIFYCKLTDFLIIYLVRAMAYEKFIGKKKLKIALKSIVQSDMIKTATIFYQRTNPSYSRLIPRCLKLKNSYLLYFALKLRVNKYNQTHERAKLIKSVFRENNNG
ncbi:hypothetical protein AGMMS49938_18200 [Fibrobacterales bacterium]|nr:hypothetical protein AGMMS49938_18200 [Fibrobacterales bacterium]